LTDDFAKIRTAISGMRAWNRSGTNIAEGLIWGERVISKSEPYSQGVAWGEFGVQKVVILLTDGENMIHGQNTLTSGPTTRNKSDYSSIGYLGMKRLKVAGTGAEIDNPNIGKQRLLERMVVACNRLKDTVGGKAKSLLYTITFEVPSTTLQDTFRSCATRPDMYYNVKTAAEINPAFESIAWELAALRISH
jgi:hypothetical protein